MSRAFVLLLALAGCGSRPSDSVTVGEGLSAITVYRHHDAEMGVTCWITTYKGAISCIPDSALKGARP